MMEINTIWAPQQFTEYGETPEHGGITEQVSSSKKLNEGIMRWEKYLF